MEKVKLSNHEWAKIAEFLRGYNGVYVGDEGDCRRFIEGVLWIIRSGSAWRLLPENYGNWNSIYKRFARWEERGVWEALFENFKADPAVEYLIIDSTIVRAHASAAGAPPKKGT